jgi:hypothetical protein
MKPERSWLPPSGVGHLECGLAADMATFDGAFRLIHDQFAWRNYMPAHPSPCRLSDALIATNRRASGNRRR